MKKDPLDVLFVNANEVQGKQRLLLAELVGPFATIEEESGRVLFKPASGDLTARHRVLIYLLARLALSLRPNSKHSPTATPKEIEDATELKGNTIRPRLQKLVDDRIVVKAGEGEYRVTANSLQLASNELAPLLSRPDNG